MHSGLISCFTVADSDYSPNSEHVPYQNPFDQTCFTDQYTKPPDQSPGTFLGYSYFDWPRSCVNCSLGWDGGPAFYPAQPFGEAVSIFGTVPALDMGTPITPSTIVYSASPSCDDATLSPTSSPPFSSSSNREKREEAAPALGEEPAPKQPVRKRGRPRLDRKLSGAAPAPPSNAPSWKHRQHRQRTPRQPHVQVERKYREGLNSDLERLRCAVPTLLQSGEGAVMGQPKPSKAMVLSCAVAYIAKIEYERDGLREGNEQLGGSIWRETTVSRAHTRETTTLIRQY